MTITIDKPELMIILGAGSSVGVGAPSTTDITTYVRENFAGPAVANMNLIEKGLARIFPNNIDINFEHIIAALEELQAIVSSEGAKSDRFIRIATAFTELNDECQQLRDWQVLREMRHAVNVLIKQCITTHEPENHPKKDLYEYFFDELSKRFRLIVLTLNYYDYLDHSYHFNYFNDGFIEPVVDLSYMGCKSFNHNKFSSVVHSSSENVLMHVHGSLHYGYTPAHKLGREIIKRDGISIDIGIDPSDTSANGLLVPSEVIISGLNKIEKLLHRAVPYGTYINAFISKLVTCPRLLLIGYGANDLYLNNWLGEHKNMHKLSDRRVTVINRFVYNDFAPPDNSSLKAKITFLHKVTEYIGRPSQYAVEIGNALQWITPDGDMQLICSGFPCAEDTTRNIIDYLGR